MNLSESTQSCSLTLADGNSWTIIPDDVHGAEIANSLAKTMQLEPAGTNDTNEMIIRNGGCARIKNHFLAGAFEDNRSRPFICQVNAAKNENALAIQLMQLSLVFCGQAETGGGVLVHGALAEKNGMGVVLAGPGETGKTTASLRLPYPWKSLSDDCTLIVKDKKGKYHVHPWPTWSTFMFGGKGGSWNVQRSIPLKAIFMLSQNAKDRIEPVGQGKAACLISETADQAWMGLLNNIEYEQLAAMSLQRFNNICKLVKTVPVNILHISRTGSFWEEMDGVLFSN
jgi:SynChlorMet cassette protein ScmC